MRDRHCAAARVGSSLRRPGADAVLIVVSPAQSYLGAQAVAYAVPAPVQVGMLQVTRNGRLKIKMGCCSMDVFPGVQPQCRSELYAINLATKDMVLLAENSKHAVAALDLESMMGGDKGT